MGHLSFDNKFTSEFLMDTGPAQVPRQTPGVLGALALPTQVKAPSVLVWSKEVASLIGWKEANDDALKAAFFSGNQLLEGAEPFASRYGGHQFGSWAGQLGDGRAISLGEVIGANGSSFEIQLKGAGLTPYSRRGDGRAVLRSSIREHICSEAMHSLGVPTTRSLCCVLTGEAVTRDMFYDGNPRDEMGAIVTRVSPTFLRFGSFEILAASGEYALLKQLVEYTIDRFYPQHKSSSVEGVAEWFKEVCLRTCDLVLHWQRIGFVHGVLNTDNMSILGVTIDYGPFGFLDNYDTNWTPNTTDAETRRYRYANQPEIVYWNLQRLAEALSFYSAEGSDPTPESQKAMIKACNEGLKAFGERFEEEFPKMMAAKIGITDFEEDDMKLLVTLDGLMTESDVDFTLFYRNLALVVESSGWSEAPEIRSKAEHLINACSYMIDRSATDKAEVAPEALSDLTAWLVSLSNRLRLSDKTDAERSLIASAMNKVNPFIVPRNFQLQEIIDELEASPTSREKLDELVEAIKTPYEKNPSTLPFFSLRPSWALNKAGCSALSCSS